MIPTEESLSAARLRVFAEQQTDAGIGTLGEKTLHKILKRAVEPDVTKHEVPLLGYVADVFDGERVTEIQTRAVEKLMPKLSAFLAEYPVTVVIPLPRIKTVRTVDAVTGEFSKPRKSAKRGTFFDLFRELTRCPDIVLKPGLTIAVLLLDVDEYREAGGAKFGNRKRGRSHRLERFPNRLADTLVLRSPDDYRAFLPEGLAASFTVAEYAKASRLKDRYAYLAVRILEKVGVVKRDGTLGRAYLYTVT